MQTKWLFLSTNRKTESVEMAPATAEFNNRRNASVLFPSDFCFSQLEPAKELVRAAIKSGIMNDLGSGNNIDICVITKQGVDYIRPYQESQYKDNRYTCQYDFILTSAFPSCHK